MRGLSSLIRCFSLSIHKAISPEPYSPGLNGVPAGDALPAEEEPGNTECGRVQDLYTTLKVRPARRHVFVEQGQTDAITVRPARRNPPAAGVTARSESTVARRDVIAAHIRTLGFAFGLAFIALGLWIANGTTRFEWVPGWVRTTLGTFVQNHEAIVVGLCTAIAGSVLAGWAKRGPRYDSLTGLPLAMPSFRKDAAGIAALILGSLSYGAACLHLLNHAYTHLDIALFFAGLGFFCLALHRFDLKPGQAHKPAPLFIYEDALAALGLGLLSATVNATGLLDWRIAWWGDDAAFFGAAKDIAQGTGVWNFFDLTYVYSAHPLLDSLYQGLVMKVLGASVVGWRASEVLLVAATTTLLYFLGTALLGRVQAVAACVILGTSNYLMAFTRLAYNNIHVIFYAVLVVLMLVLAWRTHKALFVFATGLSLGFCLYTFAPATLIGPVLAVLLLGMFLRRPGWRQVGAGVLMLAGFALVVAPALLVTPVSELLQVAGQNTYTKIPQTGPVPLPVISLVDSTLVFWVNNQWRHHYIGGPLLDPVAGALVLLGIGMALVGIKRRSYGLPLAWMAGVIVLVSLTDFAPEAHLTRLMLALPGAALLGGVAAEKIYQVLRTGIHLPAKFSALLLVVLLAVIPALNARQFLAEAVPLQGGNWFGLVVKTLSEYPDRQVIQVSRANEGDANLMLMLSEYPWLQTHYSYMSFNTLLKSPRRSYAHRPVYLFVQQDENLTGPASRKLSDGYHMIVDVDNRTHIGRWLLLPSDVTGPTDSGTGIR